MLWFGLDAWRWMFLVGVVPSAVYGVISFSVPESPRHLIAKGRADEARAIFARLVPDADLGKTMNDLTRAIEEDRRNANVSVRGPVFGLQGIVWIGIILSVFQQFVGINVIFYYSTSLWNSVGMTNSALISVVTSITNVLVTLVAIFLVDRVGRKPILLTGSVMMTVSLGAMALAFSFATVDAQGEVMLTGAWGPIALVAANLFVIGFGASWGPLVWVLLGEIFPSRIRGKALGVAAAAQWIANFLVTMSFPPMSAWSLAGTYGLYALFAALSFVFVYLRIPETKGMELEQTETLFVRARRRGRGVTESLVELVETSRGQGFRQAQPTSWTVDQRSPSGQSGTIHDAGYGEVPRPPVKDRLEALPPVPGRARPGQFVVLARKHQQFGLDAALLQLRVVAKCL